MKSLLKATLAMLLCSAAISASAGSAQGYSNNYTDLLTKLDTSNIEVGNTVYLEGGHLLTGFSFKFWYDNTGTEAASARVRLYDYTGLTGSLGTMRYDSGSFDMGTPTTGDTWLFGSSDLGAGIVTSGAFTWTVEFTVPSGASAGLFLYGPPTVGTSMNAIWKKDGLGNWQTYTVSGAPYSTPNFVATSVVPEPSTLALFGVAGLLGLGALRRKK